MMLSILNQNEKQADLLCSKDIGAFVQIQQASAFANMETTVATLGETESDDEVALKEAMEKGFLTTDEEYYFRSVGLFSGEPRD